MATYSVSTGNAGTPQALTTTYKTLLSLTAATGATTLRKAWVYDVVFGADGTPADNAVVWKIDRQTTVGTATAAAPAPLETTDAAALITCNAANTIEPTVTAATQLLEIAANQRATYRWVTTPFSGGELVVPATNTTGLGMRAKSPAYTGTAVCTVTFRE